MKLRHAEEKAAKGGSKAVQEILKLKENNIIAPSASKFYPKNGSAHQHLPPNEEEDCGLETIARWMVYGPAAE
jgi:hypothetical protein